MNSFALKIFNKYLFSAGVIFFICILFLMGYLQEFISYKMDGIELNMEDLLIRNASSNYLYLSILTFFILNKMHTNNFFSIIHFNMDRKTLFNSHILLYSGIFNFITIFLLAKNIFIYTIISKKYPDIYSLHFHILYAIQTTLMIVLIFKITKSLITQIGITFSIIILPPILKHLLKIDVVPTQLIFSTQQVYIEKGQILYFIILMLSMLGLVLWLTKIHIQRFINF